jgi:nicotinamidase-related amidase
VRATATDAHNLDYSPVVVSDCVATDSDEVNRVNLQDIKQYIGQVLTLGELEQELA